MTHDALLAQLDGAIKLHTIFVGHPIYLKALRAVVELHKPDPSLAPESLRYCICEEIYPCSTIQAIEKALQ